MRRFSAAASSLTVYSGRLERGASAAPAWDSPVMPGMIQEPRRRGIPFARSGDDRPAPFPPALSFTSPRNRTARAMLAVWRSRMYTPEILRGKAAQCRQLAAGSGKRPGRGRYLLDLAESYDN